MKKEYLPMWTLSRRRFLRLSAAGSLVGLVGCKGDIPSIFGYQLGTEALFDMSIHNVFVHTFYTKVLQTTPYRGFEVSITQEVARQIPIKTPYLIASSVESADTELIGSLVSIQKNVLNRTQQNTVREGELVAAVDVVWRDLRNGKILSAPKKKRDQGGAPGKIVPGQTDPYPPTFDPDVTQAPDVYKTPKPEPVRIVEIGRYLPELGESNATAEQAVEEKLAARICALMEKRW
jgi:hypothetical protein